MNVSQMNLSRLSTAAALAAIFTAAPAFADGHALEEPAVLSDGADVESRVSGVVGADLSSHFVSYGFDVWGEGTEPFGGNETFNPYAEVAVALDGGVSVSVGFWGDINDNANSPLGGNVQEIDVYAGVSKDFDGFSVGVVYQEWFFADQTEKILDINLSFDDSGWWGDTGLSLSPSITIHNRVDNGLGLSNGTILVLGAEYPVDLGDSELSLSLPVAVGFSFDEGYFTNGGDDGFGYISIGASAGLPLSSISPAYGSWALNAGVNVFFTEEDVYQNPDDTIVAVNLGISLAF